MKLLDNKQNIISSLKKEDKDRFLLTFFRNNAREKLTTISKHTAIPVTSIFDSLKRNENKYVKGYTALIDFKKMGYNSRVTIVLKVNKKHREEIKDYLLKDGRINTLLRINNGFDFLVEGIFEHVFGLEDFLEGLEEKYDIKLKTVYYVIDELKKERFLSSPEDFLFDRELGSLVRQN